jgi:glycosyltransferase involved in cell wall biosynthesis
MALDPAGNLWGSERVLLDFLGSELTRRHEVALCCPPNTPLGERARAVGTRVFPSFRANLHQRGRPARIMAMVGLLWACLRHRSDLIYVNQAGASRIALAVGRLLRIPVVPHVRLREDVEYLEALNAAAEGMPAIVAISGFIGGAFTRGELMARVTVLYDAFAEPLRDLPEPGEPGKRRLVCAGRLVPVKGQDLLVEAAVRLLRKGTGLELDFLGEGLPGEGFAVRLRELAGEDEGGAIRFHGFVDNVVERMASAWAVVCPSRTEPLGRVVFEAWAAGSLPVVMAGSGGAAEVVRASGGGLLCDETNSKALAKTLGECLALDAEQRHTMIELGRQWLRANTDCERYSENLLEILRSAVP